MYNFDADFGPDRDTNGLYGPIKNEQPEDSLRFYTYKDFCNETGNWISLTSDELFELYQFEEGASATVYYLEESRKKIESIRNIRYIDQFILSLIPRNNFSPGNVREFFRGNYKPLMDNNALGHEREEAEEFIKLLSEFQRGDGKVAYDRYDYSGENVGTPSSQFIDTVVNKDPRRQEFLDRYQTEKDATDMVLAKMGLEIIDRQISGMSHQEAVEDFEKTRYPTWDFENKKPLEKHLVSLGKVYSAAYRTYDIPEYIESAKQRSEDATVLSELLNLV